MTLSPKLVLVLAAIEAAPDWIKSDDIAAATGCASHKAVQQHIRRLRKAGHQIAHGPHGYRLGEQPTYSSPRVRKPRAKSCQCPCGTAITANTRSGMCQPCSSRRNLVDPKNADRRLARLRAAKATDEHRERARIAGLRKEAERRGDPEWRAYKVESGYRLRAAFEKHPSARAKQVAGLRRVALERLAWCPTGRHDEYRQLAVAVGAKEARRMIEADLAAIERRRLAALTPFEQMQEKIAKGGTLIEKPVLRRAEHAFSLMGGSLA